LEWKDTLLPGASRVPVPVGTPGSVADYYGQPVGRMDFVMGPNGLPVISGSSEAQPGAGPLAMAGPSPGFLPVDPGQYGSNPFFAGRIPSLSMGGVVDQGVYNNNPANWTGPSTGSGVGQSPLGAYEGSSSSQLQALLKALQSLTSLDAASLSGALGGGGLKIAE
jgi:hypothetical protein